MPLIERTGDLFAFQDFDALAHGVNCRGVMGKGIAVVFKHRYPKAFEVYRDACERKVLTPGGYAVCRTSDPWIYHLAVKDDWRRPSTLAWVEQAINGLIHSAHLNGLSTIGMPRIGCGLGGLPWEDVHALLEHLAAETQVNLVVVSQS
jgi:O-acetyl-ADP-ribose deacetylase (regulator of RNase III)